MTTYGYTILYVENVEKTIEFYINAFGFTQKFITPEKDYGELETGGTTLAFASYSIAEYNGLVIDKLNQGTSLAPFEIAFVTDDIEATYQQALKAGAIAIKPPTEKPWGQIVAYVQDINGFLVEVCTKMG